MSDDGYVSTFHRPAATYPGRFAVGVAFDQVLEREHRNHLTDQLDELVVGTDRNGDDVTVRPDEVDVREGYVIATASGIRDAAPPARFGAAVYQQIAEAREDAGRWAERWRVGGSGTVTTLPASHLTGAGEADENTLEPLKDRLLNAHQNGHARPLEEVPTCRYFFLGFPDRRLEDGEVRYLRHTLDDEVAVVSPRYLALAPVEYPPPADGGVPLLRSLGTYLRPVPSRLDELGDVAGAINSPGFWAVRSGTLGADLEASRDALLSFAREETPVPAAGELEDETEAEADAAAAGGR